MTAALLAALAPRVQSGAEVGVIYPVPGGGVSDLVVISTRAGWKAPSAPRSVSQIFDGELVALYTTTRCDSGELLGSVNSHDVVIDAA